MRNPILPSLNRPVPLPDCILLDAWWADLRDEDRSRRDALRVLSGRKPRETNDARERTGQQSM